MCDPTIWQPGFDLPRQQWSLLNHFRTERGHCDACRRKWRLTDTDLCPCSETLTMSHVVESCPLTKPNGGLFRLHSADEDAVSWLTSYGSWHAYEKKKTTVHSAKCCQSEWFWAISSASVSVRLCSFKSLCIVLSRVIRGRPSGLFQPSGGSTIRISLASALSPIRAICLKRERCLIGRLEVRCDCLFLCRTFASETTGTTEQLTHRH